MRRGSGYRRGSRKDERDSEEDRLGTSGDNVQKQLGPPKVDQVHHQSNNPQTWTSNLSLDSGKVRNTSTSGVAIEANHSASEPSQPGAASIALRAHKSTGWQSDQG